MRLWKPHFVPINENVLATVLQHAMCKRLPSFTLFPTEHIKQDKAAHSEIHLERTHFLWKTLYPTPNPHPLETEHSQNQDKRYITMSDLKLWTIKVLHECKLRSDSWKGNSDLSTGSSHFRNEEKNFWEVNQSLTNLNFSAGGAETLE